MIHFSRLTLSGFKSFVDKTELDIAPGLTGIVGPNGCGKSNLVEALRWVMGESSARRMRGGDMDDVIFGGTASRPARNFAEVQLLLDNPDKSAPEPYTPFDQIDVVRRIERDQGSVYRVNGKVARARDVQMLFADTATGANSPSLVSQGKLTAIITAKPFERKQVLEESAGIAGLYARRHEAELRLQAADANLVRLQDVVANLESQLSGLKKQSRQAEKYRLISEEIKQLEFTLGALEWLRLQRTRQELDSSGSAAEKAVAEALLTVTQMTKAADEASEGLPGLRQAALEVAARLQTVAIELKQLESEDERLQRTLAETQEQLDLIEADLLHDQQVIEDGKVLIATLEDEATRLQNEQTAQEGRLPELESKRDVLSKRLAEEQESLQGVVTRLVEFQTRRGTVRQQSEEQTRRLASARERAEQTRTRLETIKSQQAAADQTPALESQIAALDARRTALQDQIPARAQDVQKAEGALDAARAEDSAAREALSQLDMEQKTLERFLATATPSTTRPVLDDIQTESGFELALSQALGETLLGSVDPSASIVWAPAIPQFAPGLPWGIESLIDHVTAPDELHLALRFIGYVPDRAAGDAAAEHLKPGQSLVSRDGYVWRWDGVRVKPSAQDRQALILEHRNRLDSLKGQRADLESRCESARKALGAAQQALEAARSAQKDHGQTLRACQNDLDTARNELHRQMQAHQHLTSEIARLSEILNLAEGEISERESNLARLSEESQALSPADEQALDSQVSGLRETVSGLQAELHAASVAVDLFLQDEGRRKARLHAIADQRIALNNRSVRAAEHLEQLRERAVMTRARLSDLTAQPQDFEDRRQALMSRLSEIEVLKAQADDALRIAENGLGELTRTLKQAEAELSDAKETRAGLIARREDLAERLVQVEAEIESTFSLSPSDLVAQAGLAAMDDPSDLPAAEPLKARKDKLVRDREAIGPVNLRADMEAQEFDVQLKTLLVERDDLIAAIEELRGGIAKINREARERLMAAFESINTHFQRLFTRLYGGGSAYLKLVESDDPLGAGLEIYAQPPGKTLQAISLLSGGEQTLTAAALIFAMFLTNPAPVCVLDEIDAPLDDANVDRICDLLRDITETSQTRFLIVTHHRLTMARMDRLYGVTMSERGVSQLVSVDLNRQMDLLDAA